VPPGQLELTVREAGADEAERLVAAEEVDAALEVGADGPVVTALREVPGDLAEALAGSYQLGGLQQELERSGSSPSR
jgi:hypothetical protein